ncbi:MAG: hypothetical protein ABSF34_11865, partial [Verrucomicrobiota bacterium]
MAIVVGILAPLFWPSLHNFSFPHSPEELQAIYRYQASPSPATWTAMTNQMDLNAVHNERQAQLHGLLWFVPILIADILVIYFFWNYGV